MDSPARSDWLNTCIPAGHISGVKVGIHWTFPLFIVLFTLHAMAKHGAPWAMVVGTALLLLFVIVLAHEFGHVFAARREGVDAEQVTLWFLGGLAQLGEELMGMAEVRIAAAGPAVNLLFVVLLLPVLALAGVPIQASLFDPFSWLPIASSFGAKVLYVLYKANLVMLLFNLIPAFPIDGGRILRGFLYPRHGMIKSILVTTTISFVTVGVFILIGFFTQNFMLVLIAAFVAVIAWSVRKQAEAFAREEAAAGLSGYDFSAGHTSLDRGEEKAERDRKRREAKEKKQKAKEAEKERAIEARVDALLEKISEHGIGSLNKEERSFLEQASRRKR
jgi:Zn-dependent protease